MFGIGKLRRALVDIRCELEEIAVSQRTIAWYYSGKPAGIREIKINNQENDSMPVSNVTVGLLEPKPTAVAQRVVVSVEGYVSEIIDVGADEEQYAKFAVAPGSTINMTVSSIDAADNVSAPFVVPAFVALDTVAPDSPDGIWSVSVNDTEIAEPGFVELKPA